MISLLEPRMRAPKAEIREGRRSPRLLALRQPPRPRRGHRGQCLRKRNWCAAIATATISRRPSRSDATPASVPASRSAKARPRGTRRPLPLGRRRPRGTLVEGWNRSPGSSKRIGPRSLVDVRDSIEKSTSPGSSIPNAGRAPELCRRHAGRADNRPREQPEFCSLF